LLSRKLNDKFFSLPIKKVFIKGYGTGPFEFNFLLEVLGALSISIFIKQIDVESMQGIYS